MPKAPKGPVSKSKKAIHPNSRAAGYIKRHHHHYDRVSKTKAVTSEKNERLRQKLTWFQENLDPEKMVYTKQSLAELTVRYLDRFKGELEQISIINSIGNRKQHVARSEAIRLTQEKEHQEFEGAGVEVPDLLTQFNCDYFREWTGEIRYFPNIKLCKSRKNDLSSELPVNSDSSNEKE